MIKNASIFGGKRASPLTPPMLLQSHMLIQKIANIGNDWELVWNINSPLLCQIIAKLFIK
jgi:hypothetical protein